MKVRMKRLRQKQKLICFTSRRDFSGLPSQSTDFKSNFDKHGHLVLLTTKKNF